MQVFSSIQLLQRGWDAFESCCHDNPQISRWDLAMAFIFSGSWRSVGTRFVETDSQSNFARPVTADQCYRRASYIFNWEKAKTMIMRIGTMKARPGYVLIYIIFNKTQFGVCLTYKILQTLKHSKPRTIRWHNYLSRMGIPQPIIW